MQASLGRLAALPPDTLVCCAHEYTLGNLRFAAAAEPGNPEIAACTSWAAAQRAAGLPTLPSTLARELAVNPFLRTRVAAVRAQLEAQGLLPAGADDTACFAALRRWKDGFR
jgi:hydroxyacylglutathione hydrolase